MSVARCLLSVADGFALELGTVLFANNGRRTTDKISHCQINSAFDKM